MMPTFPRPNLVFRQTGLALGTLEAFLNAMLGLGHTAKFQQRRVSRGVGKIIVVLPGPVALALAGYHQDFLWANAPTFRFGQHSPLDHLYHQRSLVARPHLDRLPSRLWQCRTPAIHSYEGNLACPASASGGRRLRFAVPHQRVRRHGQQIALVQTSQFLAKPARSTHFIVTRDPSMQHKRTLLGEHLQGEFMPRLETNLFRHTALLAAFFVRRPFLRQIQSHIDQRVFDARYVAEIDADLTVFDFAQATAPLPLHADGFAVFFRKARWIEDDHAVGFTDCRVAVLPALVIAQQMARPIGDVERRIGQDVVGL